MQEDAPFGTHRRTKTGYGNSTTPPLENISGSSVSDDPRDRRFLLTVVSVAAAEVARPARWLNLLLGAGLMASPFLFAGDMAATLVSVLAGAAHGTG